MIRNLFYSLITKGTVALVNFLVLVISSRYLGVSSRGEISIFILNLSVIQVLNEVYTGYNLVHFIPKFNIKKIFVTGIVFTVLFCSLSNVVLSFTGRQIAGYEWAGYLLSLLVILNTFNCVVILGKQDIKTYNVLCLVQPVLLLAGLTFSIFFLKTYTFAAFFYPLLFSFVLAFVFSLAKASGFFLKGPSLPVFTLKPVLLNGFFFQATTLAYIFGNRYSYYLLPEKAQVGLYSSACSLMEAVLIIANAIAPVLLSKVANEGNTARSAEITLRLVKTSFLLSALTTVAIVLLPGKLFLFVLGHGFAGIRELMLCYAPAVLMISLFTPVSSYFSGIGRQKLVLYCYSLGFFSTLVLAPLLIRTFGVNGAAFAADVSFSLVGIALGTCFFIITKTSMKSVFTLNGLYGNTRKTA